MGFVRRTALAGLLLGSTAQAAGLTFGDNGAAAMGQGGAFVGQADDTSAIHYNPAGLTQLSGFNFGVSSNIINYEVTFQRLDLNEFNSAGSGPEGTPLSSLVSNQGGLFFLPELGLAYGLEVANRRLTFAAGVYGPPSVGRYAFNAPSYERTAEDKYVQNPRKFASNRYALIGNDQVIAFPTLSAAYQIHPRFSAGVSFQYVIAHIVFNQAVTSLLSQPRNQIEENPDFDSLVNIDMSGRPTFTAVFGVMGRPHEKLQLGASFRPSVPVRFRGTMDIELGRVGSQLASVSGNQAELSLNLPIEFRVGAHFKPIERVHFNADYVYEGWQSVQELLLVPQDIAVTIGSTTTPLAAIHIPKKFNHTSGLRLGGGYTFDFGLVLRGGILFEEAASRLEYTNIDFAHFARTFLTAGASYSMGPVDLTVSGAYLPAGTRVVNAASGTEVLSVNTDASVPSARVGYGVYTSGGWIASAGLRGKFGGGAPKTTETVLGR